ncbi:MAG: hypothetical protein IKP92_05785 [Lachnospiraceae bacterium]|nr:hypothetical protein [Lachnospiraceae bacterium]
MGEYRSPEIVPLSEDKRIRHINPFWVFIGIWFFFLILAVVLFDGKFYQYLTSYEAEYQASLPEHVAEKIVSMVVKNDMASIHNLQTEKPAITEFETEENLYHHMSSLVDGKSIAFSKTSDYTPDSPEYYITADRYIVAKLKLKKSETQTRPYKLPVWEAELFEFYTDAQHEVRFRCPSGYKVTVNGHDVSASYAYNSEKAKGEEYFKDDVVLPEIKTYLIKGLYEEATVEAVSSDGTKIKPAFDSSLGMYKVPFTVSSEKEEEMKAFMEKASLAYIQYVANDATQAAASPYFMPGTNYLQMVEYGTSRQYYPWHRIKSEECEIIEFNPYDEDHFYCQMNVNQMLLLYGTQEKEMITECRFYCKRTADGFKICGLEY